MKIVVVAMKTYIKLRMFCQLFLGVKLLVNIGFCCFRFLCRWGGVCSLY